jgi:DNA-binding transcriptional regulator YiaG
MTRDWAMEALHCESMRELAEALGVSRAAVSNWGTASLPQTAQDRVLAVLWKRGVGRDQVPQVDGEE